MKIDIEHKDLPEDDSWNQRLPLPGNAFGVPEGYFDDLCERTVSATHLHQITEADPLGGFTVPEGYFNELGSNIQSRINIEEATGGLTKQFTVPDGYFEELSANIQSRIAVEEALGDSIPNFTVPEGYFDELSSNIQSRIAVEEAMANGVEELSVPQGYFEQMSSQIEARIHVESILNAESTAFTVPEGYFSDLDQKIMARVTGTSTEDAKVVQMPARMQAGVVRKLLSTAAFKYASAACFAVIVGLAIYFGDGTLFKKDDKSFLHKELSEIPTNDIRTFLENHTDAMETERTVIAADTHFDDDTLKSALQDYVSVQ
jgi:hypothetical protein